MERRLAAILAADVVGYSRMIRADEEGTIKTIRALLAEVIDPEIAAHNGRVVKLMGDGLLLEFASAVDAVRAAVALYPHCEPQLYRLDTPWLILIGEADDWTYSYRCERMEL